VVDVRRGMELKLMALGFELLWEVDDVVSSSGAFGKVVVAQLLFLGWELTIYPPVSDKMSIIFC
jgi:hypothetical protein